MQINFKGQKQARGILSSYADNCHEAGRFMENIIVTGPAGVGKTELVQAFVNPFSELMGANIISVAAASEFSLQASEQMGAVIDAFKNSMAGEKTIICADEFHTLPLNPLSAHLSPVQRFWNSVIFGAGQGWHGVGTAEWKGESISFNRGNLMILGMTNHPERVGGKKNKDAIARRFQIVELSRYTNAEMRKAVPEFFAKKGRELDLKAAGILSRMHRGTFGAIQALLRLLPASGVISEGMVLEALPLCDYQERGFTKTEIRAMLWIQSAGASEARKMANLLINFPEIDSGDFVRHARGQATMVKGELTPTPFLLIRPGGNLEITETGEKFLHKIRPVVASWD